jgi:hypothetical protein
MFDPELPVVRRRWRPHGISGCDRAFLVVWVVSSWWGNPNVASRDIMAVYRGPRSCGFPAAVSMTRERLVRLYLRRWFLARVHIAPATPTASNAKDAGSGTDVGGGTRPLLRSCASDGPKPADRPRIATTRAATRIRLNLLLLHRRRGLVFRPTASGCTASRCKSVDRQYSGEPYGVRLPNAGISAPSPDCRFGARSIPADRIWTRSRRTAPLSRRRSSRPRCA